MILLVEDEEVRKAWFRRHSTPGTLDITGDVNTAIDWLVQRAPYEVLWLDHDLGTEPQAGRDVALWLIANPAWLPTLRIYVHSVNTVSGPKIVRELTAVGRPAEWLPFPQLVTWHGG